MPADRAVVGCVDALHTRVMSYERVSAGHSSFMVDLTQVARMVNRATSRSLIIMDEFGKVRCRCTCCCMPPAASECVHALPCAVWFEDLGFVPGSVNTLMCTEAAHGPIDRYAQYVCDLICSGLTVI